MSRIAQRGAAILMAMLTVTLVATFAAAALWQQWRAVEVETAERARAQSGWMLTGALDWARLLLREDARPASGTRADHLGEPWAVPLQEARVSSFLAADRGNTADNTTDVLEAFLSGQIIDMQSLMNVNNLVDPNGKVSDESLLAFARLFDMLGLPPAQVEKLAENLRFANDVAATGSASALAPLAPQELEQLVWLGLPLSTIAVLQPYVTVLPSRGTAININTASAEVIAASAPAISLAEAQQLVAERERKHFDRLEDAYPFISAGAAGMPAGQGFATSTQFFEVRARLRLDQLVVEERSFLRRDGLDVTIWHRQRGIVDPAALARAAARR